MLKSIFILFTTIVTSFYFFPFNLTFLPGVNTKMLVAAFGLIVLGMNLVQPRNSIINRDFLILSLFGGFVSLIGFVSIVINETSDFTYATYIVSMWVWLAGAYAVTRVIKAVHNFLSIQLVCHYLVAVCVIQCIIAFVMGQYSPLKDFVDGFLASEGFMGKVEGRLYGIGASLDVAGMRFAATLTIIAYFSVNSKALSVKVMTAYMLSCFIIIIIGNMIARTTSVGIVFLLVYWLIASLTATDEQQNNIKILWKCFIVSSALCLPCIILLYHTDSVTHNNIRFAFEGFFNFWETGEWKTHSTEILKNMYVFPDNIKTWVIGDGYFDNPNNSPYYIGPQWNGFYKDTDVGYLRFIFYFGVVGLCSFILYMCKVANICLRHFNNYKWLFFMIAAMNFLIWFKVSSDLFLVFALFLCVSEEDENTKEVFG